MRAERAAARVSRDYERYARKMAEIKNSMDRAQYMLEAEERAEARGEARGEATGEARGRMKIVELLESGKPAEEIIREFRSGGD